MEYTFDAWLKKRRRALDFTQQDLAARAFCSVTTIRKIEANALVPSKALALELARALNIPETAHAEFVRFARTRGATAPENKFTETPAPAEHYDAPPQDITYQAHPPAPLTAALGREHDTGVITRILRLPNTRLVTLTGPPGTGKTRLSLEVANALQDEYENGAAFVTLAPVSHASLVETAVAQALELYDAPHQAPAFALRAFLRDKQLLLVLDNFEHVLDAASLVTELLRLAPRLKILVTSREPLRLYGEREIALAPLDVPALAPLPALRELENYPAVQLFVERAQQVDPAFALTRQNAPAVARLVVGLDGLPLAIEMAAARVKWQTPEQLLAQWSTRLEVLAGRPRDLDTRQRTLRGALDWSYELLEPAEQRAFRRLGVFRGGLTADAAAAVLENSAGAILQTLVEKSLVKSERVERDTLRYDLLETLREYALEQLARTHELEDARARHAAYYRQLVHSIADAREHGMRGEWQRFDARDAENFRVALDWYAEHDRESAVEFATDLHGFWADRGLSSEGRERLTALLRAYPPDAAPLKGLVTLGALAISQGDYAVAQTCADRVQARTATEEFSKPRGQSLLQLGYLALMRGEFGRAQELLLAARTQFQALGLPSHEARALNNLGLIAKDRGDFDRAQEYHLAALALRRELGLRGDIAQSLFNLAIVAYWRGEYARAIQIGQEAYELFVADAGNYGGCYVLETIGMAYFKLGEFERAMQTLENSLAALRRADDKRGVALLLHSLGDVALERRDYRGAQQSYREALQLSGEMGEKRRAAFCLEGYATALLYGGSARRAVTLLGAAEALRETIGVPVYDADRAAYEALVRQAQQKLGKEEFADAWAHGRALDWQQAIGLAML